MAAAKEIRTKISSVKNTRKVTSALEMVSASKIKKAQDLMLASRPYSKMMKQVIGHIAHANPEYQHPFMLERERKKVGFIVISTDRGLCGGLNINLFKRLIKKMVELDQQSIKTEVVTVGSKAEGFFKRAGVPIVGSVSHLGENPHIKDLIGIVKLMLDAYTAEKIDALYVGYNDFVNTMTQQPVIDQLLPLPSGEDLAANAQWDYIYEPDAKEVLDEVLARYIESLTYQAILENLASEHSARMIAMKNASDNASKLIDDLQLVYNKARQAAITQEISEIVGGAAAV